MLVTTSNSFADFSKKLIARAKDIKERVEAMRGKRIVVGIPPSAKYPNGESVVQVADCISYGVNENGSPMRAGPRRFMTVAAEENKGKWSRMLQKGIRDALRRQKNPNLRPVLLEIGEEMKSDIQKTMLDMDVYDTGRMHDSISVLEVNHTKLVE